MSAETAVPDRSSIDTNAVPPTQVVPPPVPGPKPHVPLPPKPGFSLPTVLTSVVLSLGAGALGAWGIDRLAEKPKADAPPPKAEASAAAPFPESAGTALSGEVETLQKRVIRLEEGIAAIPKDQPIADVNALKAKVGGLEKTIGEKAVDQKLGGLDGRVEKNDKALVDLQSQIQSLRQALDADHSAIVALKPPASDSSNGRKDTARPAVEDINVDGEALARGAELLEQKKFADAREVFRKMEQTHPTDARVWYYSALATGFATADWPGQAERLVLKGIEREKAGTPEKSAIDATFSNLSKASGKDWLDAYRQRVK